MEKAIHGEDVNINLEVNSFKNYATIIAYLTLKGSQKKGMELYSD